MRKSSQIAAVLFLFFFQEIIAQNITRGPYLQLATSSSIIIRWRTDIPTTSQVKYGFEAHFLNSVKNNQSITMEHEIELNDLLPGTRYYYSVGNINYALASGSDYYFKTAPIIGTSKASRVWVIGDAGTANYNQRNVRDAYLNFSASVPTDLWIMLGDNAYERGTDAEYQEAVFNLYPTILRNSVVWPAFGNHDAFSASSSNESGVFYDIFSLPDSAQAGGVASGTEAYYSFEYANIHFVCLNSHDVLGPQFDEMVSWLDNDLKAHGHDWTIAFWHHPPYSKGSHNSDSNYDSGGRMKRMREDVLPVLEAGGVDVVLSGHSHSYERSYLLDGHYDVSSTLTTDMILDGGSGQADGDGAYNKTSLGAAGNEGTVYVVAGSSGKTSSGALNHPAMYASMNVLGSVILDFDGNQLDLTFIDDHGTIRDYLSIIKGAENDKALAGFSKEDLFSVSTEQLLLLPNYPNPFNSSTAIEFKITKTSSVRLEIYSQLGRRIQTLLNTTLIAGTYKTFWDGKNNFGENSASGIYYIMAQSDNYIAKSKIVLIK